MTEPPAEGPVRVYCDGIFDLLHLGHFRMLEQAKKKFPNVHLLVGVCGDEVTHKHKGVTVMTEQERYDSVRHCRWVDEVIEDAPWVIDQAFLDKHHIDFVAHDDDPYPSSGHNDVYMFVKSQGRFLPTQRTEGISTSDLIARVLKKHDAFIARNLKKGYTEEDLGMNLASTK